MLERAPNFRDVGPLPTRNGGALKPGALFRSGELSRLSNDDLARIETLGIKLVCDLRSGAERQRFPSRWPALAPARIIEMPTETDRAAGMSPLIERLAREPGPAGARRAMLDLYASLPTLLSPILEMVTEAIATGWNVPALLHCHVGKDRTGVATALLLAAVDITPEAIRTDYLETAGRVDIVQETRPLAQGLGRLLGRAIDPGTLDMLGRADPAYLDAAFDAVARMEGGPDGYFAAIGLTVDRRTRLRSLLVA